MNYLDSSLSRSSSYYQILLLSIQKNNLRPALDALCRSLLVKQSHIHAWSGLNSQRHTNRYRIACVRRTNTLVNRSYRRMHTLTPTVEGDARLVSLISRLRLCIFRYVFCRDTIHRTSHIITKGATILAHAALGINLLSYDL